jgi:hypothetical protein
MLDCSRTFQSVEYLKKTIDRLGFYKMDVFHLHLTEYPFTGRKVARTLRALSADVGVRFATNSYGTRSVPTTLIAGL